MTLSRLLALATFVCLVLAQGDPQTSLNLDPSQVSPGLANNGQDVAEAGQVPSLTTSNNFINFCLTQKVPLTNGQQVKTGSCNPVPMGHVISTSNMPRSKFVFPPNGDNTLVENTPFTIKMAIENIQTGAFVNAAANYYGAPAQTNAQGLLIGHSHVVVQAIPSMTSTDPLDLNNFAFFKGLNDKDVNGILTANVTSGLAAGVYRLASINTAANHQPALVAVAQHGCLEDFVYFTVNKKGAPPAANPATAAAPPPAAAPAGGGKAAATTAAPAASASASAGANLQTFPDALGGIKANPVTQQGTQFLSNGRQFANVQDAIADSCNTQRNSCADKAGQTNNANGVTLTSCDTQQQACLALDTNAGNAGATNLQTFNQSLGSVTPPPVFASNGTFAVSGQSFPVLIDALKTSCENQRNLCADKANQVQQQGGVTIAACDTQQTACFANAATAKSRRRSLKHK